MSSMLFDRVRRSRALSRAREALGKGDMGQAIRIAEGVLREDADNAEALRLLGQVRLVEDDVDQAQALLERALDVDPENDGVREQLGEVHARRAANARELGDLDEAVSAFQEALPLVKDKAFIYYNIGCAYADFHLEHAAEAVAMWRRATEERADYVEAHFDLGTALFHSERHDEALPHFEAVVEHRPDWPAPQYLVGVIFAKRGDVAAALERLRAAVKVNPSWARTAAEDDHLASLRGNPDFEALLDADALIPVTDMTRSAFGREEILADLSGEADKDEDDETPPNP